MLSALGFSLTAVLLHGAFREPDNLFLDDGALEVRVKGVEGRVAASWRPQGLHP